MMQIFLQDNSNNGSQVSDLRKLVDNVYRTHDDSHIWQHKMTSGRESILPLKIVVQLQESITIALLRIWNYNKSRCHSYRGIKYLQINLNNQLIFSGEIAKASGDLTGSVENFGDVSYVLIIIHLIICYYHSNRRSFSLLMKQSWNTYRNLILHSKSCCLNKFNNNKIH